MGELEETLVTYVVELQLYTHRPAAAGTDDIQSTVFQRLLCPLLPIQRASRYFLVGFRVPLAGLDQGTLRVEGSWTRCLSSDGRIDHTSQGRVEFCTS